LTRKCFFKNEARSCKKKLKLLQKRNELTKYSNLFFESHVARKCFFKTDTRLFQKISCRPERKYKEKHSSLFFQSHTDKNWHKLIGEEEAKHRKLNIFQDQDEIIDEKAKTVANQEYIIKNTLSSFV